MTVQVELTAHQEAELKAVAEREGKTIAQSLLARAFPDGTTGASPDSERRTYLERSRAALERLRTLRARTIVPDHLRNAKIDVEFAYSE